jgi:MFS family permease
LLLGWLTDRIPLRIVVLVSCLGAALSSAFLWGFAESNAMLVAFAVTFGLCLRLPRASIHFVTRLTRAFIFSTGRP